MNLNFTDFCETLSLSPLLSPFLLALSLSLPVGFVCICVGARLVYFLVN